MGIRFFGGLRHQTPPCKDTPHHVAPFQNFWDGATLWGMIHTPPAPDPFSFSKFKSGLKASIGHIAPSFRLAYRSAPKLCIGITAVTLLSAVMPLGIAYMGKMIVDAIVAKNMADTLYFVGIEAALILIQSLILRVLFLLQSLLGAKLGADVNGLILEKAVTLELRHFEDSEIYDKLTNARRYASTRPVAMVTDLLQLIQNSLTFLGYIGLLLAFNAWIVLALILAAIPAAISEMRFSNATFRLRNWRSPETRRLNYLEWILATDEHVKEVKILGLSTLFLGRYKQLSNQFYLEDKKLMTRRSIWAYCLSILATCTFYIAYGLMAIAAALGRMSLGDLTMYVMAFRQGQQAFQSCLTAIGNMYEGNLYMSNLFDFLAIETREVSPALPQETAGLTPAGSKPPSPFLEEGLRFENVGFCYAGKTTWALRHITLFIPKGESLALVGHNGAGKSTFIKLLCRLYEPTEGQILLDGKDIQDWNLTLLRQRMGVVFQDFNQYQLSFRENVGLGNVNQMGDESRILKSIEEGGASDVLASMTKGLDTSLGRWFNAGVELSGGQWQKVALSRGFMREDADILILDEPTASLDAVAEQAVFERFQALTRGKTSILISHRFPTVRMADRIVVIEQGRIVEEGTHSDLLAHAGRYAHLFSLQAKGYA
jgi:ATP-binding cassette subfamily B protein